MVLSGGKGGVGTTTLAVNLAVIMARNGVRTVLVDADPDGGNVALLCGLEERYTLADVLAGRRTVAEVLRPGPDANLNVLPGVWGLERLADFPPSAVGRLLAQLASLGANADWVLLDAGNRPDPTTEKFWQAADRILVVATPDTAAIIDAYALIKLLAGSRSRLPIQTLVNLAATSETADNVHGRIARACQRFLGVELATAGHVPEDPLASAAGRRGEPFVIAAASGHARPYLERIAREMVQSPDGQSKRQNAKQRPGCQPPAQWRA
jgi:flagellar biosynthesis protein FlhG